jgi:hypothetical protein
MGKLITHGDLISIGRKWLASKSPIVITEIASVREQPD